MTVLFSPWGNAQFVDANGDPLVGGKIYSFIDGSSTPLATYTDPTGTVPQNNPIILNSRGAVTNGEIWLTSGMVYKFQLFSAANVLIDTIPGISGVSTPSSAVSQWSDTGVVPTYISSNSYTLIGDQTTEFHIGRRQKFLVTSGIVYGRITSSVFTTLTTVTIQPDGLQTLDSGLSSVQNSILTNNVLALPERIATTTGSVNVYVATVGISRLVIGDEYKIKIATANDGALAPTLNLDATGALPILTQNGSVPQAGALSGEHIFRATSLGFILLNPNQVNNSPIQSLTASVASNALTINYAGGLFDFRSGTLTNGTSIKNVAAPATSITVPSGATLGISSTIPARIVVLEAYNNGSPVICLTNIAGGLNLDETNLISPTVISAGSSTGNIIYSASAVAANSPYRLIGYFDGVWATAGTWNVAPTQVQGAGGLAMFALLNAGFVQTWKSIATKVIGTTYYNSTNKTIIASQWATANAASQYWVCSINGTPVNVGSATPGANATFFSAAIQIPAYSSYVWSAVGGNPASYQSYELS